jgi:CheY-like chemotaxis protein
MTRYVLIVEDDRDVRESMQMVLELEGHLVLTAANGAVGLEVLLARADEIALVLLDVLMPVLDGWGFLEARRLDERLRRVPTVVFSAAHPSHPASAEATAFLSKPVGAEELLAAVARWSPPPSAEKSA